ncbi:MAG: S1C family serine protease [Acidobacteriota bacterium]
MLKRPLWIAFLAAVLCLPAVASVRASQDPDEEKIIVLPDEADDDVDVQVDAPDVARADDMVVRIERDGHRGYLGVQLVEMTPELREHFGVSRDAGVLVGGVEKDSPAAKAGVLVGDIVTAADGDRVDSPRDLSRAVRRKRAGETVKLDVSRDRAKKQLTVTAGERKDREIRLGELGPHLRRHAWVFSDEDGHAPLFGSLEDMGRLRERLDELEKRLRDLEKKVR